MKRFSVKWLVILTCTGSVFTWSLPHGYAADGSESLENARQKEATEVQIDSAVGIGSSGTPLLKLARAIEDDKEASRFRLNWTFSIAGDGGHSTLLYDRTKHTAKLHATYSDALGKTYTNTIYSDISDETILQLAKEYGHDEDTVTNLSFFDQLPNGKDLGGAYVSYQKNAPSVKRTQQTRTRKKRTHTKQANRRRHKRKS